MGKKVPAKPSPARLLRAAGRLYDVASRFTGKAPDLTPEGAAMISRHIDCDCSRAPQELAYRFTPVRQLLEETCDWMLSEGLLT